MKTVDVIVIGGGAAGFFSAINYKLFHPDKNVIILEKTSKLLSKVFVSGGGRCNVTNSCFDNKVLIKNYPRGEKQLQQVFSRFSVEDTINWFKNHGVLLHTEADGRMFPVSNSSNTIINCFLNLCNELEIKIITHCEVLQILPGNTFEVKTTTDSFICKNIICSIGGHPKENAYQFIKELGHTIVKPIPSLFTINLPSENIKKELQGISVENAKVSVENSKLNYTGPLLITHWGLSGPAVLKLSAFAAEFFYNTDYKNNIIINWLPHFKQQELQELLLQQKQNNSKAFPYSSPQFKFPKRLWEYLLQKAHFNKDVNWANVPDKWVNKLCELLQNDIYKMEGKTTFKEEFVTAGGINLNEINFKTMESKIINGLYFCGEVINVDGITGGFNFQAAWSTAFVAASSI